VRRPGWWCYPQRCSNGHEWGPGLITVSWVPCDCPPAVAARGGYFGAAHLAVYCDAEPGCQSVWYRPRHERWAKAQIVEPGPDGAPPGLASTRCKRPE